MQSEPAIGLARDTSSGSPTREYEILQIQADDSQSLHGNPAQTPPILVNDVELHVLPHNDQNITDQYCCSRNFDVVFKISLIALIVDLLCMPRFVILPVILTGMLGGPPIITIFPWMAWAMISTGISLLFLSSEVVPSEVILGLWTVNRKDMSIVIIVWSVLDFILSLVNIGICLAMVIVIFPEPDGLVNAAWSNENMMSFIVICISGISFLARLVIIFNELTLSSKLTSVCSPCFIPFSLRDQVTFGLPPWYSLRTFHVAICTIYFLLSFGASFYAIDSALYGNFYALETGKASYSICDPMVPEICSLPFPSAFWLEESNETETGYQVNIGSSTLPFLKSGNHQSAAQLNQFDGFSVSGPILWALEGFSDISQFNGAENIENSVNINSTSLILDLDTGNFCPHFTERDDLYKGSVGKRLFYSVPATSLNYSTRYIIIIHSLKKSNGGLFPASTLAKKYITTYLNGGSIPDDTRYLRFSQPQFGAFAVLQNLGVPIEKIQLIWDFHTVSEEYSLRKIRYYKDRAIKRMNLAIDSNPIESLFTRISIENFECPDPLYVSDEIAIKAYYRISVPWFLDNIFHVNNFMRDDLSNLSTSNEDLLRVPMSDKSSVGLMLLIPCSVSSGTFDVGRYVEFGHGIFADRLQSQDYFLLRHGRLTDSVFFSLDWRGFSRFDLPLAVRILMHNFNSVKELADAVYQGYINRLAAIEILPRLLRADSSILSISSPANLPNKNMRSFIGLSMGGILGSGYMALANYSRGTLLVSGSPFTFLIARSDLFGLYLIVMGLQTYDNIGSRILLTSMQIIMDPLESSGWASTGVYEKTSILLEICLGDSTVTTIGGAILSRNIKALQINPIVQKIPLVGNTSVPITAVNTIKSAFLIQGKYPGNALEVLDSYSSTPPFTNTHKCFPYRGDMHYESVVFLDSGYLGIPCHNINGKVVPCVFEKHAEC